MDWNACSGILVDEGAAGTEQIHGFRACAAAARRAANTVIGQVAGLLRCDLFQPLLPAFLGRKLPLIGASDDIPANRSEGEKRHGLQRLILIAESIATKRPEHGRVLLHAGSL